MHWVCPGQLVSQRVGSKDSAVPESRFGRMKRVLGGQSCCYSAGSFRGTADGTVSRQVRHGPANLTIQVRVSVSSSSSAILLGKWLMATSPHNVIFKH